MSKKELASLPLAELLKGINDFTKTARERDLTTQEQALRQAYRQEYIRRIGANLRSTLDHTTITFADEEDHGSNRKKNN